MTCIVKKDYKNRLSLEVPLLPPTGSFDRPLSDRLYENCVILTNDKKGEQLEAHVSRVKKYNSREVWKLSTYNKMIAGNEIDDYAPLESNPSA